MARNRKRLTKKQRIDILNQGSYAKVYDLSSLKKILEQENTQYSRACLYYIERQNEEKFQFRFIARSDYNIEKHHIIPRYEGGPDENWNLVLVFHDEHMDLHYLRYEAFKNPNDLLALRFRKRPMTPEEHEVLAKQMKDHHEDMKKRQVSFYSKEVQRNLATRPRRHTQKREDHYVNKVAQTRTDLFKKTLKFIFQNGQIEVIVPGETLKRTGNIKPILLQHMPTGYADKQAILEDKHFSASMNKVLNKLIPNTSKELQRNCYKGWTVEIID